MLTRLLAVIVLVLALPLAAGAGAVLTGATISPNPPPPPPPGGDQFAVLKYCTVQTPYPTEALVGDCAAYATPATAQPAVYDGTAGTIYTDPVFGTKIKRLTPQTGAPSGANSVRYSTWQAWSKNGTYMVLNCGSGELCLYHGTDPYTWIPRSRPDGSIAFSYPLRNQLAGEEPSVWWLNTDDCKFLQMNALAADGFAWKFQTVDICGANDVTADLTPQANAYTVVSGTGITGIYDTNGNLHDLRPAANGGPAGSAGLVLIPFIYNAPTDDDQYILAAILGNNGDGSTTQGSTGRGFCLFQTDYVARTVTAQWCHWLYGNGGTGGPGDLYFSGYPVTRSAQGQVTAKGASGLKQIIVSWNTGSGVYGTLGSLVRSGNVVTATSKTADWSAFAKVAVGATINIWGIQADTSFNGTFTVASLGTNTFTYSQTGADSSLTGLNTGSCTLNGVTHYDCNGMAFYNHFGHEVFDINGNYVARQWYYEFHSDNFLYADGSEGFVRGAGFTHNDSRALHLWKYGTSTTSDDGTLNTWGIIRRPDVSNPPQMHVSGMARDLPGYVVYSTYTAGASPDCSPQQPLCGEVTVQKTDGSNTTYRVAHTHNVMNTDVDPSGYYTAEPHSSPNRNLTKIIWSGTWGATTGGSIETYVVELPIP